MIISHDGWIEDIHRRFMALAEIQLGTETHKDFLIMEFVGEVGELANARKKILRDGSNEKTEANFREEAADAVITLINVIREFGIDIEHEVALKLEVVERKRLAPREAAAGVLR